VQQELKRLEQIVVWLLVGWGKLGERWKRAGSDFGTGVGSGQQRGEWLWRVTGEFGQDEHYETEEEHEQEKRVGFDNCFIL
jgi:hypothetical protein